MKVDLGIVRCLRFYVVNRVFATSGPFRARFGGRSRAARSLWCFPVLSVSPVLHRFHQISHRFASSTLCLHLQVVFQLFIH